MFDVEWIFGKNWYIISHNLTMEDITNADYKHVRRVWEDFGIENLSKYLYTQSYTLLLADTF